MAVRSTLCALALGASALHAGAASALTFNFSFSGGGSPQSPTTVTGIIEGLIDNTNDQTNGLTATILSATNTPPGGWPVFTNVTAGQGFDVSGGEVTGVNIRFEAGDNLLLLGNQNGFSPQLQTLPPAPTASNINFNNSPSNTLVFTAVDSAEVPGPLPVLGAGAAFGFSRKLRRRISASQATPPQA
jgi:hypothetical protein